MHGTQYFTTYRAYRAYRARLVLPREAVLNSCLLLGTVPVMNLGLGDPGATLLHGCQAVLCMRAHELIAW